VTLVASGFDILDVSAAHAELAPTLVLHHRDPFDRMLVAQAITLDLTLVTADRAFADYDVPLLDASA
jgi:PIN domain nuclease of toxin-antitoxin system